MSYNGYANYETWNVCLWFQNDEWLYIIVTAKTKFRKFNAETAKSFVMDVLPDGTPDFADMGKSDCYKKVKWSSVSRCLNEL